MATASKSRKPALTYVEDSLPGITRRRAGKGWAYYDPDGDRITDREEISRLNAVAMPPAYTDCWFCPAPDGHILGTGIDARGRKQYRYHPEFRAQRECEKFDMTLAFGKLLPVVRERVASDLKARGLTRAKALANVVRLLDTGAIRVGSERYARSNGSFGATTLRMRHSKLEGSRLRLRFRAKSGKLREMTVTDRSLIRFVKRMQDLPGQHLFKYLDEDGEAHPVSSCDVNEYLLETMGESFTAKHFRTWHASVLAYETLQQGSGKLSMKAVMQPVCEHLGNTPAIARKSYVHPSVTALIDTQEEWRADTRLPYATKWLSRYERGLIALLESETCRSDSVAA